MRVPVLQNINWDPSAPEGMHTNSVHTDRHIYTAAYAGKDRHADVFRHSYTHGDTHTQWSQSRDRCDCSDHRNRTTSGLTVRYVAVSLRCTPLYPKHTADASPAWRVCVCRCDALSISFQFAAWKCYIPHTHTHTPDHKVWLTKKRPLLTLMSCQKTEKWE